MKNRSSGLLLWLLLLAMCTGKKPKVYPQPINTNPAVFYNKDVKPIFEKRCAGCHNGATRSTNWLQYSMAYEWRELIKTRVYIYKDMPYGRFPPMPDDERAIVKDWVEQGARE